jgi:hypothetical protein
MNKIILLQKKISDYFSLPEVERKMIKARCIKSKDPTQYSFIPFGVHQLIPSFIALKALGCRRFLDVGCGVGNIVKTAEMVGFKSYGIECNQDLKKLQLTRNIGYIDAFEFDFYDKYDLIYYFRPMCDETSQLQFEYAVIKGMKPGAYLMGLGSSWQCFNGEYRTKFNQSQVEEMIKEFKKLRKVYIKNIPSQIFQKIK